MQALTVRESMAFAAKIRTNCTDDEINTRIDKLIDRLGLKECQDTPIGGPLAKGVSGGERKRTSIGYELMTNPSVVLLDEPTSGLDSHTSKKILELLRKEAQRGTAVLATIH